MTKQINSAESQSPSTQSDHCKQVFKTLCSMTGDSQLDLFATKENHQLPIYISPILGCSQHGLGPVHSGLRISPVPILPRVLVKIKTDSCRVLIAPAWPKQSWYPSLLELLMDRPI